MKDAVKAQDRERLSVLRFALAALQNKEKELRRELTEQEVMGVITGLIKKSKEAVEQFKAGGRNDLATKEEGEIGVLQSFLPKQLTIEELQEEISKALTEVNATSANDMGKVMKVLMPRIAGRADGKLVNELVRKRLSG